MVVLSHVNLGSMIYDGAVCFLNSSSLTHMRFKFIIGSLVNMKIISLLKFIDWNYYMSASKMLSHSEYSALIKLAPCRCIAYEWTAFFLALETCSFFTHGT